MGLAAGRRRVRRFGSDHRHRCEQLAEAFAPLASTLPSARVVGPESGSLVDDGD